MKKFLSVFLTAVMLFALSGCNTDDEIGEYENVPPIMFASVYDNAAWGYQQRITVVDSEGKVYSRYRVLDSLSDDEWIDIYKDGLYERLLDFVENESPSAEMTADEFRRVRWNVQYFEKWNGLSMREYDNHCNDYGTETLFGVYFDSNGAPQLAELACYGDRQECRNGSDVKKFVNSFIFEDDFKFT